MYEFTGGSGGDAAHQTPIKLKPSTSRHLVPKVHSNI